MTPSYPAHGVDGKDAEEWDADIAPMEVEGEPDIVVEYPPLDLIHDAQPRDDDDDDDDDATWLPMS